MKNIIEFIGTIADGGAESIVRDYARLVSNDEFKVIIVTIYPPLKSSANYRMLEREGIDVISIFPDNKLSVFYRLWNKLTFNRYIQSKLLNIIKKVAPNAIHVHLDILRFVKPIAHKLIGVKLLYTCHSLPSRLFNTEVKAAEFAAAKYLLENECLQMVALHNNMRVELNALFSRDDTIVVYNGVDLEAFSNVTESKEVILRSIGVPTDAYVVGHIGRFISAKNHSFLLKVFCSLKNVKENAYLLMIGSGPLKNEIEEEIQNLGIQNCCKILEHRTDIPQLLKSMDVFVFPSIFEGLPVTLVEAQAANKRCVVSDSITEECFLSANVIPLSISDSPQHWVNAALDTSIKGKYHGDISQFDMRNVVKYLRFLYS